MHYNYAEIFIMYIYGASLQRVDAFYIPNITVKQLKI